MNLLLDQGACRFLAVLAVTVSLVGASGCTTFRTTEQAVSEILKGSAARPSSERLSPPGREPLADSVAGAAIEMKPRNNHGGAEEVLSISLREVLEAALSRNIDLALSRAEEEIAKTRAEIAEGRLFPRLEAGGGAFNTQGRVQGSFGDLDDVNFNTFDPQVGAAYRVNLGAEINEAMASELELEEAVYRRLSVEQRLLFVVTELYQSLVLGRAGIQIAEERLADAERIVSVAEARLQANLAAESDVSRARTELSLKQQEVVDARNLWERASIRLAVVLRKDPEVLLEPAAELLAPEGFLPVEGSWDPVLEARRRPDVEAARRALDATSKRESAAWWDLFGPDLYAEVRETFVGDQVHDLKDQLGYGAFVLWSFSLDEAANIRRSKVERRAAELRLTQVEDEAVGEVEEGRKDMRAAMEKVSAARDGLESAETSLRLSLARFQAGTAIILEVIEAQDALARVRLNLSREITRFNRAQVKLLAASGKIHRDLLLPSR